MKLTFDDSIKHTNEDGGTQTKLPVRCDLLPPQVLLQVSAVLAEGADKYGEWNWESIGTNDHINHAQTHILRYMAGDISEPHLIHAICRLLFAAHTHHQAEQGIF